MAKRPYRWNEAQYKLAANVSANLGQGLLLGTLIAKLGLAPDLEDIKIAGAVIVSFMLIWLALKLSREVKDNGNN